LPNREAYEDLLFRIEQLEHRMRLLEGEPPAPTRVPPESPEDFVPQADDPPAGPTTGIDVAAQPPRNEPDDTPGLSPRA
jgi:hypothetical protein